MIWWALALSQSTDSQLVPVDRHNSSLLVDQPVKRYSSSQFVDTAAACASSAQDHSAEKPCSTSW